MKYNELIELYKKNELPEQQQKRDRIRYRKAGSYSGIPV